MKKLILAPLPRESIIIDDISILSMQHGVIVLYAIAYMVLAVILPVLSDHVMLLTAPMYLMTAAVSLISRYPGWWMHVAYAAFVVQSAFMTSYLIAWAEIHLRVVVPIFLALSVIQAILHYKGYPVINKNDNVYLPILRALLIVFIVAYTSGLTDTTSVFFALSYLEFAILVYAREPEGFLSVIYYILAVQYGVMMLVLGKAYGVVHV